MGLENWNKKPTSVREAVQDGNKGRLSEMGKKGAEIKNQRRADKDELTEIQSERLQELRDKEDEEQGKSANEHIIDSDGDDLDYGPKS